MEHLKFVSGLLFICQKTFLSLRCAVDFVKKKPSSTTRASPPAVVSWPVKNNLDTVQALTILKLNFETIQYAQDTIVIQRTFAPQNSPDFEEYFMKLSF